MSPALQQALQQVVSLRGRLSQTKVFNRYVTKLDRQETELEQMLGEIETLQTKETQQKRALDTFLMELDLE